MSAAIDAGKPTWFRQNYSRIEIVAPGVVVCIVVAAAAAFLSDHYGAPVMLFALLLGLAMNFLSAQAVCRPGIDLVSKSILRIGVALLGARLTVDSIVALGWPPVLIVFTAVSATIVMSIGAARLFGFNPLFGLLSGGATAICGASAALALSAALPAHPLKERATVLSVICVSVLSTVAMIVYPLIAAALGLDSHEAGVFLGASIHDVAQVVGAGYSVSPETGDTATVVKLVRVGLLLPLILVAALVTRMGGAPAEGKRPPLLPWFAVGFLVIVLVNSTGVVSAAVRDGAAELSRWCLISAIAGLGMKTQLRDFAGVGPKPVVLMIVETAFLAGLVLLLIEFLPA